MANTTTQSFANHTRLDPTFHFFLLPLGIVAIILSVIHIIHHPSIASTLLVVLAVGFFMIAGKSRGYSLKVQDRIIRLEERLRLSALLPESLRARIQELTEAQLIALRFAADEEVPSLVEKALRGNLEPKAIKQAIQTWRPDYWRV